MHNITSAINIQASGKLTGIYFSTTKSKSQLKHVHNDTPKSSGFLKNSSSLDFDALNVALKDARLTDLEIHRTQ